MKETSFSTFSLSVAIFMSFFSFKAALSSEAYPIKKNTIADTEELIKILEGEIEALEKMKITYEEIKNKDNNRQRFEQTFRNKILLSHDVISKQGEIFNSKLNSEFKAKEISKDSLTSKETRHLKYGSS